MSEELRARARAFLDRPVPEAAAFVPDSLAETLLARYASTGVAGKDAEQYDLCAFEAEQAATAAAGRCDEEAAYFGECAAVLRAIHAEARRGRGA